MGYRTYGTRRPAQSTSARGALVTPRQSAALDKMAEAHGFASGSALLADVASCTATELGRQPRSVVQMFVDQAFARYGRASRTARDSYCPHGRVSVVRCEACMSTRPPGRCEDAPCCGCCD